jgi:hypothetical protein
MFSLLGTSSVLDTWSVPHDETRVEVKCSIPLNPPGLSGRFLVHHPRLGKAGQKYDSRHSTCSTRDALGCGCAVQLWEDTDGLHFFSNAVACAFKAATLLPAGWSPWPTEGQGNWGATRFSGELYRTQPSLYLCLPGALSSSQETDPTHTTLARLEPQWTDGRWTEALGLPLQ